MVGSFQPQQSDRPLSGITQAIHWRCSAIVPVMVLTFAAVACPAIANPVSPDGSLSTEVVQPEANRWTIEGGDRAGSNLFHSFREFSIPTGGSVHFNNAADVVNIFSRVTGGQRSTIDGLLSANGGANLFLLNPSGILFGPNARLNLGGSFFASTADRLVFADGLSFGVDGAGNRPLLSMSVPVGLQYGSAPGSIRVEARSTDPTATTPAGLQVQPGQAIGLFGGSLEFEQGWAIAPEGRIWAVAAGPRTVVNFNRLLDTLIAPGANLTFQGGGLEVSGNGGGELVAIGDRVQLGQGALLAANTLGTGDGRGLWVRSGEFGLTDRSAVSTITLGSGRGGDLSLTAQRSITLSSGRDFGSFIQQLLNAQFGPSDVAGGLFSVSLGSGNAGRIVLGAENIDLSEGSVILTSTFGAGRGGDVLIDATGMVRLNRSGLISGTAGSGRSGDLTSQSKNLELLNSGVIASLALSSGSAGDIDLSATDSITLIGGETILLNIGNYPTEINSGIVASSYFNSGNSGQITVRVNQLFLRSGALIATGRIVQPLIPDLNNSARNGRIIIEVTNLVEIDSNYTDPQSTIASSISPFPLDDINQSQEINPDVLFEAGTIEIHTKVFRLIRSGQIQSATFSFLDPETGQITVSGNGNDMTIVASERIELDHLRPYQPTNPESATGLFANINFNTVDNVSIDPITPVPSGRAGNIRIVTPELILRNGARITASSLGAGGAGNIDIQANRIRVIGENSGIRSLSGAGDAGNIRIQANEIELRDGGAITTNAVFTSTGGNINIDTDTLAALENSDISANSVSSFGGRVNLRAQGVFGTAFREALTDLSDITASSARGPEFSGTVQLDVLNPDSAQGAIALPSDVGIPPEPAQTCGPVDRPEQIGFFPLGRAGRQPTPVESTAIEGTGFWADLRPIAPSTTTAAPLRPIAAAPVEATGWQPTEDGRLVLVATGAAPVAVGQSITGRGCWPKEE